METRGGSGEHNPYIYLESKTLRVIQSCSHGDGIFRSSADMNLSPPSPNDFYTYCYTTKQLCTSTEASEAQRSLITGLLRDVSELELKRKVEQQLADMSAALGYHRSYWEYKEREVNPACKKTVYSPRAEVFTYPLQLRVNSPHAQSLITRPCNQLVVFRTYKGQEQFTDLAENRDYLSPVFGVNRFKQASREIQWVRH